MVARVLIIGGYGNFGTYITRALAPDPAIRLIIGGRSQEKTATLAASLNAGHQPETRRIDIDGDIRTSILDIAPDIVIHTTGPFQIQDYRVADACIDVGSHYLDLADARSFVTGIGALDQRARERDVLVVSGASSVPCLSAAVVDHFVGRFERLESVDYGISAAQHTNRGLATASAVLSFVGKPFMIVQEGRLKRIYGWQGLHAVRYPELGLRLFGHCDIPDLEIFPIRYPGLRSLRFAAGHELKGLHIGTWLLSWLVRLKILPTLSTFAQPLASLARLFDPLASGRSGFHMILSGRGRDGRSLRIAFYIIARSGHGPNIPCMPAILLARQLAAGALGRRGATPCLDLITLEDYLKAMTGLDISVHEQVANA